MQSGRTWFANRLVANFSNQDAGQLCLRIHGSVANYATEQMFGPTSYYTHVTQLTRRCGVHRIDTHQGRP